MGRRHSAAVIIWTLAHYRVTTVWLHVEDDHTMLMKFIVEDCGLEGLSSIVLLFVSKSFDNVFRNFNKNKKGRDKKKNHLPVRIGSKKI